MLLVKILKKKSSKESTGVNKQVCSSNASSNYNLKIPNKYVRHHDENSNTDSTKSFKLIDNTLLMNTSIDKVLCKDIDKTQIIREAITVDTINNLQFPTTESQKVLLISNTVLVFNIIDWNNATPNNGNLKLGLLPISKESPYITIDTTDFITKAKNQKEIGKNIQRFIRETTISNAIVATIETRCLNYTPIEDPTRIMNEKRESINVNVIDKNIKEMDHSNQNVDNITCQSAKISSSLNTSKSPKVAVIPNPTSLFEIILSSSEDTAQQLDSFLKCNFSDVLNS